MPHPFVRLQWLVVMDPSAFLAAIVESSSDAIVGKSLDGVVLTWNAAATRMFGYRADEIVGQSIKLLIPDDRVKEENEILASIKRGDRIDSLRTVRIHKNGNELFVSVTVSPVRDTTGRVVGASKIVRDIGEETRLRAQLTDANTRFNLLADNISQLAWIADGIGWIFWYNKRWYEFTGTSLDEMQGWGWKKVHHPDHIERVVSRIKLSWETGEPWEDTFPLRGVDGEYRWFLSRAMPIRDAHGNVQFWFGTNTDITALRIAENRNKLLLHELVHRSKNMMALVQTIARHTAAQGGDFINQLEDRIASLAANQDLLVRDEWTSVSLRELIDKQLAFVANGENRISCNGPDLSLSPSASECLSMAIHELTTNALKYGCLASPGGHVEVNWDLRDVEKQSIFEISWRESGGAIASPPTRSGFGSQIIAEIPKVQLSAAVTIEYPRAGLHWRLSAHATSILAQTERGANS
jgi:PAS domain S-box-containing protein